MIEQKIWDCVFNYIKFESATYCYFKSRYTFLTEKQVRGKIRQRWIASNEKEKVTFLKQLFGNRIGNPRCKPGVRDFILPPPKVNVLRESSNVNDAVKKTNTTIVLKPSIVQTKSNTGAAKLHKRVDIYVFPDSQKPSSTLRLLSHEQNSVPCAKDVIKCRLNEQFENDVSIDDKSTPAEKPPADYGSEKCLTQSNANMSGSELPLPQLRMPPQHQNRAMIRVRNVQTSAKKLNCLDDGNCYVERKEICKTIQSDSPCEQMIKENSKEDGYCPEDVDKRKQKPPKPSLRFLKSSNNRVVQSPRLLKSKHLFKSKSEQLHRRSKSNGKPSTLYELVDSKCNSKEEMERDCAKSTHCVEKGDVASKCKNEREAKSVQQTNKNGNCSKLNDLQFPETEELPLNNLSLSELQPVVLLERLKLDSTECSQLSRNTSNNCETVSTGDEESSLPIGRKHWRPQKINKTDSEEENIAISQSTCSQLSVLSNRCELEATNFLYENKTNNRDKTEKKINNDEEETKTDGKSTGCQNTRPMVHREYFLELLDTDEYLF